MQGGQNFLPISSRGMRHQAKPVSMSVWLLSLCSITSAGLHRITYLQLVTPQAAPGLPKRLNMQRVDDLLLSVYDSDTSRLVPRNGYSQDNQEFWRQRRAECLAWDTWVETTYEVLVQDVNASAPQMEPYYMQVLKTCDLNDATSTIQAFTRYALNGEDVLKYQGNHNRWISVHPAAWPVTERLNQRGGSDPVISHLTPQQCTALLNATGSFIAQKTAQPTVHVVLIPGTQAWLRRLICHVTGFYPRNIEVTWERRGQVAQGEQLSSGILPNADPTFQIQVSIELGQEGAGPLEHVCVVRHSSLGSTPLRVTWVPDSQPTSQAAVLWIVAFCILAAPVGGAILGCWLWKRPGAWKQQSYPAPTYPRTRNSSSSTEKSSSTTVYFSKGEK